LQVSFLPLCSPQKFTERAFCFMAKKSLLKKWENGFLENHKPGGFQNVVI